MTRKRNNRRRRRNNKSLPLNISTATRNKLIVGSRVPRWVMRPSYKGEIFVTLPVQGTPTILTTTVTTGVIANSATFDMGDVPNFTTRYGGTFRYYMVQEIHVDIIPLTVSTGVTVFYWSEASAPTPTSDLANQATPSLYLVNSNADKSNVGEMVWRPSITTDFRWTETSDVAEVYNILATYTNSANYGAPTAATALWLLRPTYTVVFRDMEIQ